MGKFFRQRTESNPDLYCKSGLNHCLSSFDADELCAEDTEGVSTTVEDIGTSEITILIANNSGEEFTYGEYFSLQKQIDGQWYTMPVRADNVGFQDIAHILPDREIDSYLMHCVWQMLSAGKLDPDGLEKDLKKRVGQWRTAYLK
jgi:hypothetical protein